MNTKIIQLTSGKGPAECCWVLAQVLKFFIEDIKTHNIKYEILQREKGPENGTLQSATLQLSGNKLDAFLSEWLGTIQWIGKSTFRKFHKRKNWFVGIQELKSVSTVELSESDVKFQAIRSSGPGGQHVNKVSSAVRATHTKTGIHVLVSESRSQHQNKKTALKRLQEKVMQHNNEQLKSGIQNQRENHLNLQRGNPVKIFKGTDFKVQKKENTFKKQRQQLKTQLRRTLNS